MAAESGVRIGDAERERVSTSLREHYVLGRLTLEEFQQRLDATLAAKTDVDLARVTADLPHAAPQPSQPTYVPPASYPIDAGQGYQWRRRGPLSYAGACMALCLLAVLLIASFSWPFGGAPRIVIILLAILAVFRRIFGIGRRRR